MTTWKTSKGQRGRQILCVLALLVVLVLTGSMAEEEPVLPPMTGTLVVVDTPEESEKTVIPEATFTPEPTESPEVNTSPKPTATPDATATPAPTDVPREPASPYEVIFSVPSGWTSKDQASVSLHIVDATNLGWKKIEYRQNGNWSNLSDTLAATGKTTLQVSENGTLTVRVIDPHGHVFEETCEIEIFDRTAPTVKARVNGEKLKITAKDSQSGVAGVQVNGLLFTELDGDSLSVLIDETLLVSQRLAVRAFDYAGNFSDPLTLENPRYEEPKATPSPTPTPAPVKTAGSSQSASSSGTAIYMQTTVSSASSSATPIIVYATPEPSATPIIQKEYITLGPGMPYQKEGNSHTLDMLYSASTNKQFITLQTKSGNTFYLVIDYDKPVDEDAELYETYFLNLVDERDLYDLIGEKDMPTPSPTPQVVYATSIPTAVLTSVPQQDTEPKKDSSTTTALIVLLAMLGLGGVAGFLYLKNKSEKHKRIPAADYGLSDDDDEEEP